MLPLWDTQPHKRPPIITLSLIVACIAVFGYECALQLQGGGALETFVQRYALVPSRLIAGWSDEDQWLTLVTHVFLHGSLAHVLGNGWFLWIFGRNVEDRFGSFGFLLFFVFGGLGAAALQILVGPGSAVPMIGASGAISAVLGAYFILLPTSWIVTLVPWVIPILPVPAFVFLILWFALQAVNGFGTLVHGTSESGGVAWWAHAGGFLAGVCLTLWAKNNGWVRK